MTSQTGQIMQTWATCKPQKTLPTRARLFRVRRWQHTKALLCHSSQDSWEGGEFYQAKTVKTHSNNLVVLAHIQLMPFYRLSTHDVTHVRKCTRPSPSLPYCKRQEAGRGPGNEARRCILSGVCWFVWSLSFAVLQMCVCV